MPTHILIVEGDAKLSGRMRTALEQRGFSVEETSDGRTCLDLARREAPRAVVLGVDLPAGQNGYILCGKLKKDDQLRAAQIAIVGNPEGFAQHGKLKNRADLYVSKPVDLGAFVEQIVALTGHLDPIDTGPEGDELTEEGDPDLALLDAAFDDSPSPVMAAPPLSDPLEETARVDVDPPPPSHAEARSEQPQPAGAETSEAEELRATIDSLKAALDDAQAKAFSTDVRVHQLEAELERRQAIEEREGGGLREQLLRKDKDLLRLRSELHAREEELAQLRDRESAAEQQLVELNGEVARKDALAKSATARAEQLVAERRRSEQAVHAAHEEIHGLQGQLAELQEQLGLSVDRVKAAERELERAHGGHAQLEAAQALLHENLATVQRDLELNRAHAEGAQRQLEGLQVSLEQSQSDLATAREQLDQTRESQQEELAALRARLATTEAGSRKHEERVTKLYARVKLEERLREKTRKAVAIAAQLLAEPQGAALAPAGEPGPPEDEPAAA